MPQRWRKKAILFILAVTMVLLAALIATQYSNVKSSVEPPPLYESEAPVSSTPIATPATSETPQSGAEVVYSDKAEAYEGGAELFYTDEDGTYQLFLTFDANETQGTEEIIPTTPRGNISSYLIIRQSEGATQAQPLKDKIERIVVAPTPLDGAQGMTRTDAMPNERFPNARCISNIYYEPDCGTNEIRWTVYMKNGDMLTLRHRISVPEPKRLEYHYEDIPMSDIDSLRSLIQTIESEVDPDTLVALYLPPTIYKGGLELHNRAITIYGSTDGKTTTTFTAPTIVTTELPTFVKFYGVNFVGSGEVGISATASLYLSDCVLRGWDTAAFSGDGSWISALGCTFEKNDVGLHFNTKNANNIGLSYHENRFLNNGTGLLIEALPRVGQPDFIGCLFSGNSEDIQDLAGIKINTYASTFE